MLEKFPVEVPVVQPAKAPSDLAGFFSEADPPASWREWSPKTAVTAAATPVDRSSWSTALSILILIVVVTAGAVAPSIRAIRSSPAPSGTVARDIVLPAHVSFTDEIAVEAENTVSKAAAETDIPAEKGTAGTTITLQADGGPSAAVFEEPRAIATSFANEVPIAREPEESLRAIPLPSADTSRSDVTSRIAVAAPPVVNTDEPAIRRVLDRYQNAYERLDAAAAQQIWPSVDRPALARAFAGLESQSMTFDDCRIAVAAVSALASCHGHTTYVTRVGRRASRTHNRAWMFRLQKSGDTWQIDSVQFE